MFINKKFTAVLVVALFFVSNQAMAIVSGQLLWERHYGSPKVVSYPIDSAVDNSNNIYVIGNNDGDIVTVKYNSNGKKLWTTSNGANDCDCFSSDLAIDKYGNIFTTTTEFINNKMKIKITKHDKNGTLKWDKIFGEIESNEQLLFNRSIDATAIDSKGSAFILAQRRNDDRTQDALIAKYDSKGNLKWQKSFHMINKGYKNGYVHEILIDKNDNVVAVVSDSYESNGNRQIVALKFDNFGNKKWQYRYRDAFAWSGNDNLDAEIDQENNLLVGGSIQNRKNSDFILIKLNPTGKQQWVRQYDSGDDFAAKLATDNVGNAYLIGTSHSVSINGDNNYDTNTIKFDASGNRRWARKFDGIYDHFNPEKNGWIFPLDWGREIAIGNNNSIYVLGTINNGPGKTSDIVLIKYSSSGRQRWARKYNDQIGSFDKALDLIKDSSGNMYITGNSNFEQGFWSQQKGNFTILKYAP